MHMIKKIERDINREILYVNIYKLLIEIKVEEGEPLSSDIIVDLKNEYDNHLAQLLELKNIKEKKYYRKLLYMNTTIHL